MPQLDRFRTQVTAGVSRVTEAVIGRWHWQPPVWLGWITRQIARAGRYLVADLKRAGAALLVLLAIAGAWLWYKSRPVPHYVPYKITAPGLTRYGDNGIASIDPLIIEFGETAAPLQQIEKTVTTGVAISPRMAGSWYWASDRTLRFTPKNDWPVDGSFTVSFASKGFFARGVLLEDYRFDFKSAPFAATIAESQFYQDPVDPNLKKLVATVSFTHPVDTVQFEQRVSLALASDAQYLGLKPDSKSFSVVYDKFNLAAHIHSAPLAMPRDDTSITLRIDKGVRAARGGNETKDRLEAVVVIPGRTSLRFSGLTMVVVDNARFEPEQVLMMTSSSPVAEKALGGKVTAYLLPERHPNQPKEDTNPYRWDDENQVGKDILALSKPVALAYVSSEQGGDTSHGFKFLGPVGRYLFVQVAEGVEGTGGYIAGKPYVATIQVIPYPQALTFLGKGALLSLSGDRKVGFLVRGVDHVEVEIGRVLANQVHHLAPEMRDFTAPSVSDDLADKIVERFTEVRDYTDKEPGKPTYDNVDLGNYLQSRSQGSRGLFLLRVRSVQPPPKEAPGPDQPQDQNPPQPNQAEGESESGPGEGGAIEDTRLILVTDLGFIVKQAKDGTRDVFVQSIRSGLPIDGVRVEAVGRNGQAVATATTEGGGRARLPKIPAMKREKAPLMIVAQKDSDFSFMPFQTGGRTLDLSRFDTGGIENDQSVQQLSAYLFSDRGIYRPGETTHLGMIVRTADWKSSLTGLPIAVEITDSRGNVVSRSPIKLSAAAFEDVAFTSQPAAPTGTYQAVAYLVKSEKEQENLGSTSFKVQEFEPDRMKVRLDLSDQPAEGWLKPDDVKPRVTVAHLFGEAASNRRVDGEMDLSAVLPVFARYPEHRFQAGQSLNEPFHEALADTVTDDKGIARFKIDLGRFTGRVFRLNLLARAYEAEGGRNVAAESSAIVSDGDYLVGVKPDGDLNFVKRGTARQANWLAVNQRLNPVAADKLTLEWVQLKYVSVLTQQSNQTYKYVSRLKEIVRNSRKVRIASGGSMFPLPTQEPGDFVLVLRDESGSVLNSLNYTVAGEANITGSLDRDAELQIQLDKSSYAGGDTIEVSIRAPYTGAGLITIERDRVLQHQWFKTSTTSSVQRVQLPRDFEGNGYVGVEFVRDPSSDEIFLSPLSYGAAPFSASLTARTEPLRLNVPTEIKPGTTINMQVVPGEASRVALLAVDEGILQVARYHDPDPLRYFFQKRRLEVDTTQILDLILPEFQRFVALAAPGGDAESGFARHLNPFAKKRKPPVAYWSGIVDVGPAGQNFRYAVPDYFNGKLRIVAIAVSAKRVGTAAGATDVKGSFIMTPNVPSMAAPGDEFEVGVGLFNNTTGAKGPIHLEAQLGAGLALQGPAAIDLLIADQKEGTGIFRFKANSVLGPASVKFVARRGAAEAQIEESVSVRPAVAYRTQLTLGRFDNARADIPVTRQMYNEKRRVEAAVSPVPLIWGPSLIAWLDDYPYSCTEQLVSKGMSTLLLTSRPEFGSVRSRITSTPASTFPVLQSRQNDSGGFGLWSSSPNIAEFPSVYAAQFLLEAKDRGQKIPAPMLASLNEWLTRYASTPASTLPDARWRAYAVYLLARQGINPASALSNVEQELSHRYAQAWPSDLSAGWLAATYRLMQRNGDADRVIAKVPWSRAKHDFGEEIYYDSLVHDSQLLYLLARHFPARLAAVPPTVLEDIGGAVSDNRIDSLSAAWTLLALDAYAKAAGSEGKLAIAEVSADGRERALSLPAGAMPKAEISTNAAKVRFGKEGPLPGYYSLDQSGFDRVLPPSAVNQGVEVIHEFLDLQGNVISKVTVGQEFLVRVRLRPTVRASLSQIAVVDLLPGGTEAVLELRPPSDSTTPAADPASSQAAGGLPIGLPDKSDWTPQHVDVRDDRVVLYGDLGKNASTFVYRVRATNAGIYQAPPASAEGMYDRKISGLSQPGRLEIVKP
ncbi:MAG TPA: alpha-2-macroglobulin [Bryobacteraceae bacterium]|nr:alpha-2-macroglobulin [Bryobacteraceae bacterium]